MIPTPPQHLHARVLAEGLAFPEGPVAMADGSLLVVELQGGRLTRVGSRGELSTVAELGGGPSGAALGPDGAVYICNSGGFVFADQDGVAISTGVAPPEYSGGSIQKVDLGTGRVQTLYAQCEGRNLISPNDLVFDDRGGFYFTDLGKIFGDRLAFGALYYATADGSSIRRLASSLLFPNGCGLSPDGGTLYVAHTILGWLTRWVVLSPGVVTPANATIGGVLVGKAAGRLSFHSMAVELDGTVCITTLGEPSGGVTLFDPSGSQAYASFDHPLTTNICFGGADNRTAFITSGGRGRLLAVDWPRPGLRLNYA